MARLKQKRSFEMVVGIGIALFALGIILWVEAPALLDTSTIDAFVWLVMLLMSILFMILGVVVIIKGLGRGIHESWFSD